MHCVVVSKVCLALLLSFPECLDQNWSPLNLRWRRRSLIYPTSNTTSVMTIHQVPTCVTRTSWYQHRQVQVTFVDSVSVFRQLQWTFRINISAFYDEDPVDLALKWAAGGDPIPVIMPANEKRAGGDWEAGKLRSKCYVYNIIDMCMSGVMQPEECLCRRSNLYATLTTPNENGQNTANYPIPTRSGIYSNTVGM